MADCPACVGYSDDVLREIERAGRAHHAAMDTIRFKESKGYPLDILFDGSPLFRNEAEQTALALGF